MDLFLDETFWLTASDGVRLYGRCWLPVGEVKAAVCLVHGFAEHSGSYEKVGEQLAHAGIGVVSCDWRGHGRSEGRRGYTPSYQRQTMADLSLMMEKAGELMVDVPRFFYGHSMGGGMVLNHVLRLNSDVAGVICTSPMLRVAKEPSVWEQRLMRYLLRPVLPYLARTNYSPDREPTDVGQCVLTRDLETELLIRRDALRNTKLTYSMAIEAIDAGAWVLTQAGRFDRPLLLMVGNGDRVISVDACRELAAGVAAEWCTYKEWEGGYHELHRDIEAEAVIGSVADWVMGQIG